MRFSIAALLLFSASASAQTDTTTQLPANAAAAEFGSPCVMPSPVSGARVNGATDVTYSVVPSGRVVDVAILNSSVSTELNDAAIKCLTSWNVIPGGDAAGASVGPHRAIFIWETLGSDAVRFPQKTVGQFELVPAGCTHWYPNAARRDGEQGTTIMQFEIQPDGNVLGARVFQSSGNADLDNAAVACVKFFHYRPAIQNGKPVVVTWKAAIKWQLR